MNSPPSRRGPRSIPLPASVAAAHAANDRRIAITRLFNRPELDVAENKIPVILLDDTLLDDTVLVEKQGDLSNYLCYSHAVRIDQMLEHTGRIEIRPFSDRKAADKFLVEKGPMRNGILFVKHTVGDENSKSDLDAIAFYAGLMHWRPEHFCPLTHNPDALMDYLDIFPWSRKMDPEEIKQRTSVMKLIHSQVRSGDLALIRPTDIMGMANYVLTVLNEPPIIPSPGTAPAAPTRAPVTPITSRVRLKVPRAGKT